MTERKEQGAAQPTLPTLPTLPTAVQGLMERLEAAGYEAWAVGGCVRDALRGVPPHDWDLCTSATPEQMRAALPGQRLLSTGEKHGTLTAQADGMAVEITTYRAESGYADHRRPDAVRFSGSLREDLARRDFTVNAMAYAPGRGLADPFGGRADLALGVLRCVGNPAVRFSEDALRILRALRFVSVLGFSLEPATLAAARAAREDLRYVSAERVYAELSALLLGRAAGDVLREAPDLLAVRMPCILPTVGFLQHSRYHDKDVWGHIAAAVEAAPSELSVRWAALLHDVGKPACFALDGAGHGHFYGHDVRSAELARETLCALRAPAQLCERVCLLVRWHDAPLEPTARCAARWLRRLGAKALRQLLALKRADAAAHAPGTMGPRLAALEEFSGCVQAALAQHACFCLGQLAVNGRDVMAAGAAQGPEVGRVLDALLCAVIEGELPNERAALCKRAEALLRAPAEAKP